MSAGPIQLLTSPWAPSSGWVIALLTLGGVFVGGAIQLIVQRRTVLTTILPRNLKDAQRHYLPLKSNLGRLAIEAESCG